MKLRPEYPISGDFPARASIRARDRRLFIAPTVVILSILFVGSISSSRAQEPQKTDEPPKQLSLSELGNVEVSPHHEATAQVLFNLPKGFEFGPVYRYVGALPALAVKSYHTADARLGWHFAKQFELCITGQNLFQPRHLESGFLLIERSAYAQITWKT